MKEVFNIKSIKNIFEKEYENYKKNNKKLSPSLIWEELVGKKILEHSKIIKIEKQKLYIAVDHQAWSIEIDFKKNEIIEKFKKDIPELKIKDVICLIDETLIAQNKNFKKAEKKEEILKKKKIYEDKELDESLKILKTLIEKKNNKKR